MAIYIRVSTAEQGEGHSLEGQRKACRDYCDRQGYAVTRIHQDRLSGKDDDRPAFQYLMRLASLGAFDALIVWRRDRFFRNAVEAGFWESRLKSWGVRVESVQQGPQEDNRHTRLVNGIVDLISEMERGDIAERCTMGRREAARAGLWPHAAPYGYRKERPGEASRLILVPEEAHRMREAYAECIRGANKNRLALMLGMSTTQGLRRLQNPTYKGQALYAGIVVPVPAIVTPEVWQEAQDAIDARYANRGKPGPVPFSRRFP